MANCSRNSAPYSYGHSFDHLLKIRIRADFESEVLQPIELNNRINRRKTALSEEEESHLKVLHEEKGRRKANIYLLDVLVRKEDWLPNLLKALRHPDIGLEHLADQISKEKEYLESHPEESSDSANEEQRQSNTVWQPHRQTLVKTLSINTSRSNHQDKVDGHPDSESNPQYTRGSVTTMSGKHSQQLTESGVLPSHHCYPEPESASDLESHVYDDPDYITLYDSVDDDIGFDNKEYLLYDDWAPVEEDAEEEEEEEEEYNDAKSLGPPQLVNLTKPNPRTPDVIHDAKSAPTQRHKPHHIPDKSKCKTVSLVAPNTSSFTSSQSPQGDRAIMRRQVHSTGPSGKPTPCRNSARLYGNRSSPEAPIRGKETHTTHGGRAAHGGRTAHGERAAHGGRLPRAGGTGSTGSTGGSSVGSTGGSSVGSTGGSSVGSTGGSSVGNKQGNTRGQGDHLTRSSRDLNSEHSRKSRKSERNYTSSKCLSHVASDLDSGINLRDLKTEEKESPKHTDPEHYFTREEVDKELSTVPGYMRDVTDDELDVRLSRVEDGTYFLWYYQQKRKPALTVMYGGKPTTFLLKKRSGHTGVTYTIFEEQFEAFTLKELITHHLTSGIRYLHREIISLQAPLR